MRIEDTVNILHIVSDYGKFLTNYGKVPVEQTVISQEIYVREDLNVFYEISESEKNEIESAVSAAIEDMNREIENGDGETQEEGGEVD